MNHHFLREHADCYVSIPPSATAELLAEFDDLTREWEATRTALTDSEDARNRLCDARANISCENEKLRSAIAVAKTERDRLRGELATLQTQHVELERQYGELLESRGVDSDPLSPPLDFTKPVRTRNGRKVRILCTDRPGSHPVVGLIGDSEEIWCWMLSGRRWSQSDEQPGDLVQDTPQLRKTDCWIVAKIDEDGDWKITGFKTEESANNYYAKPHCRVRVKLVEGQHDE